jgi:hypothetical protein
MDLHHQTVVDAHARHLHEHVGDKGVGIALIGLCAQGALKDRLAFRPAQPMGTGRHDPLVSGSAPKERKKSRRFCSAAMNAS